PQPRARLHDLRERRPPALHARDLTLDLRQLLRQRPRVAREGRGPLVELRQPVLGLLRRSAVTGREAFLLRERRSRLGEGRVEVPRRRRGLLPLRRERLDAPAFRLRLREQRVALAGDLLDRALAPADGLLLLAQ